MFASNISMNFYTIISYQSYLPIVGKVKFTFISILVTRLLSLVYKTDEL